MLLGLSKGHIQGFRVAMQSVGIVLPEDSDVERAMQDVD
jgi:hypothetical protein